MTLERWKEIIAYHQEEEKAGVVINEKVATFRRWFAEKLRTEQEIDEYWNRHKKSWGQNKQGKVGSKTSTFLLWLNTRRRTEGEIAKYWKANRGR